METTMRVIAGRYKGRRLKAPAWPGLRPTSDRLKETLFAILAPIVEGARVLDGYAGSGALGIEALSRGAAEVVFVEYDRRAVTLVEDNLRHCGIGSGYVMIRGEFASILRQLPAHRRFDLALLDPPYEEADVEGVLRAAAVRMAPGGTLVLEHARRRQVPGRVEAFALVRQVTAGDSALAFFREAAASAPDVTEGL
jgi:16S rRNA (guanine966-N2)-methyltransferase